MKTLNELFDNPYDYKRGSAKNTYQFDTATDTIVVIFKPIFELETPSTSIQWLWVMSFKSINAKEDDVDNKTNKGDQFRTFATISEITKYFYKNDNVGAIIVATKETSSSKYNTSARKVIYKKLLKKFGSGETIEKIGKNKELARRLKRSSKKPYDWGKDLVIYKKGTEFEAFIPPEIY